MVKCLLLVKQLVHIDIVICKLLYQGLAMIKTLVANHRSFHSKAALRGVTMIVHLPAIPSMRKPKVNPIYLGSIVGASYV